MSDIVIYKPEAFESIKPKMLQLIDEPTYLKEISFACQALKNNSYLAKATQDSVLTAVYNVSTTGLSLNPILKFAALVPRYTDGAIRAVLEPQYQGLVKLLTDTGAVTSAYAYAVYEGDDFDFELGTQPKITHKPKFKSKKITLAYAVGVLPDGKNQIEVMNIDDIYEIRAKSESYKAYLKKKEEGKIISCFWVDHEGEMVRKTPLKRLCKYLPKSGNYEKLAAAIDLDNQDYTISNSQQDYLLKLLRGSTYWAEEMGQDLENKIMGNMTEDEYHTMKGMLQQSQLDPVTHGGNYNQGDIDKHLKKLS